MGNQRFFNIKKIFAGHDSLAYAADAAAAVLPLFAAGAHRLLPLLLFYTWHLRNLASLTKNARSPLLCVM